MEATITTQKILVQVKTQYMQGRSLPYQSIYYFSYHITITNGLSQTVQLLSRHWRITDGHGRVENIKGMGVIGVQPKLAPGQCFSYTSYCPLNTPVGSMQGVYHMITETGENIDVGIAPFTLALPYALN